MFGLPMEIVGPIIGFGAIIFSITAGIISVRLVTAKIRQHELKSGLVDSPQRDHLLAEVQNRLGELDHLTQRVSELEERVDFAERLMAQPPEDRRLGPPSP
jgi:hypothetical protein